MLLKWESDNDVRTFCFKKLTNGAAGEGKIKQTWHRKSLIGAGGVMDCI